MQNTSSDTPRRRVAIVAMLGLFMAVNFADKAIFGLVAVPMMKELGISHKDFGTIAGSFFFLFAISGIAMGFVSNRVPTKILLCILVVIWSLSQIPIAAGAGTIAMLMAARILLGIGEGPAYPLALHACYKWYPDKARTVNTPNACVTSYWLCWPVNTAVSMPWPP